MRKTNTNKPFVSIEAKMGIFTGGNEVILIYRGFWP